MPYEQQFFTTRVSGSRAIGLADLTILSVLCQGYIFERNPRYKQGEIIKVNFGSAVVVNSTFATFEKYLF